MHSTNLIVEWMILLDYDLFIIIQVKYNSTILLGIMLCPHGTWHMPDKELYYLCWTWLFWSGPSSWMFAYSWRLVFVRGRLAILLDTCRNDFTKKIAKHEKKMLQVSERRMVAVVSNVLPILLTVISHTAFYVLYVHISVYFYSKISVNAPLLM